MFLELISFVIATIVLVGINFVPSFISYFRGSKSANKIFAYQLLFGSPVLILVFGATIGKVLTNVDLSNVMTLMFVISIITYLCLFVYASFEHNEI